MPALTRSVESVIIDARTGRYVEAFNARMSRSGCAR
jgi:hypothetical protein